jgi:hypothetical protein
LAFLVARDVAESRGIEGHQGLLQTAVAVPRSASSEWLRGQQLAASMVGLSDTTNLEKQLNQVRQP